MLKARLEGGRGDSKRGGVGGEASSRNASVEHSSLI